MYRRSDSAEAGHYASMFDNIEEEQQGSRDSDERRSAADKRRDDSKQVRCTAVTGRNYRYSIFVDLESRARSGGKVGESS